MDTHTADLRTCLERECALVRDFIDVLRDEALALEHPDDSAALQASTQAKNRCADDMATIAGQRDALLAEQGMPTGKPGLDAASHDDPALAQPYGELLQLADEARRMNLENGTAIETYLAHTQRAMRTLRSLAGSGSLYDARGRATA